MKSTHLRWLLVVAVTVVGIAAYGAYLASPGRSLRSITAANAAKHVPATRFTGLVAPPDMPTLGLPLPPAVATQRPVAGKYREAIREGLFSAPQPVMPKPRPLSPPPTMARPIVPPIPQPDPLADAIYSGSVTVDGKTMALIESRSSRQGQYVAAGDRWQNLEILAITPASITMSVNGAQRALAVSDALNVVPLARGATGSGPAGPSGASPQGPGGGAASDGAMQQVTGALYNDAIENSKLQLDMASQIMNVQSSDGMVILKSE